MNTVKQPENHEVLVKDTSPSLHYEWSRIGSALRLLFVIVYTMSVAAIITGCASSSIQNVKVNISPSPDKALYLLPFEPPTKQLVVKDRRAQSYGVLGTVDLLVIQSIKEANPSIYDYTIDERDLANLRQSLLQSFKGTKAFITVKEFSTEINTRPPEGMFLIIRFEEAGIVKKFDYAAVIKGSARLEDGGGTILGEVKLDVHEVGRLSVSQAKNNAIKQVVKQTAGMLNTVVTQKHTENSP